MRSLACDAVQCPCCPTRRAFASGDAETTPKKKRASKADAPADGSNERHHHRHGARLVPDLTNKNADVKRKEEKNQ